MAKELTETKALTLSKNLIFENKFAILGTILHTELHKGWPYNSLVQIASKNGKLFLLVSELSDHTKNIQNNKNISLLFDGTSKHNRMNSERITIVGFVTKIDKEPLRELFTETHPKSKLFYNFEDFSVYEVTIQRGRYIGGFGKAFWLSGSNLIDQE